MINIFFQYRVQRRKRSDEQLVIKIIHIFFLNFCTVISHHSTATDCQNQHSGRYISFFIYSVHAFCLHNTTATVVKTNPCLQRKQKPWLIFLNQQFITRSARADCCSYFVTTLNRTRGKEKGKEKRKEKVYIKRNY